MAITQDLTENFEGQSPPAFGHGMHKYFGLDPEYINLNNGSYGSAPLPVLEHAHRLSLSIERNPDLFMRLTYQPLLESVRAQIASLIKAEDPDECVIVQNASIGINTVLRNFEWTRDDTIIAFSTTYGSVSKTVQYLSDIPPHPHVSHITLDFPTTHAAILAKFRAHLASLSKPKTKTTGPGKIVAVIDSIISNPGYKLPWKEMAAICEEYGVWSVIDAAHSIGQEVDIDVKGVDFWVSNCHKWLYARRSASVLYVPKRNQPIIKSSIPTSHMYVSPSSGQSTFIKQFEWSGTIDFVPYLSIAQGLQFRCFLGGEHAINDYCHSLAREGGKTIAKIMNTELMDPSCEGTLSMVNVALPLPNSLLPTIEMDLAMKRKLLVQRKAYVAHFYHNGRWWARLSAQVWNEIEDFEKMGEILNIVCNEIVQEFGTQGKSGVDGKLAKL